MCVCVSAWTRVACQSRKQLHSPFNPPLFSAFSSTSSLRSDHLFWQTVSIRPLSADEMQQPNQLQTPIGSADAARKGVEWFEREGAQQLASFLKFILRSRHKFRTVRVKICSMEKSFVLRRFHVGIFIAFCCFQLVELCSLNVFIGQQN